MIANTCSGEVLKAGKEFEFLNTHRNWIYNFQQANHNARQLFDENIKVCYNYDVLCFNGIEEFIGGYNGIYTPVMAYDAMFDNIYYFDNGLCGNLYASILLKGGCQSMVKHYACIHYDQTGTKIVEVNEFVPAEAFAFFPLSESCAEPGSCEKLKQEGKYDGPCAIVTEKNRVTQQDKQDL